MPYDGLLLVLIWADVEPDTPEISGQRRSRAERKLTFRGVEEGVPAVRESLSAFEDDDGGRPKVTWCLQADDDIASSAGQADFLFTRFAALWEQVQAEGDEIGWHPHLLRFSSDGRGWVHEVEDREWVREMMTRTWEAVRPHGVRVTRQGMDYADREIISLLEAFGVAVDGTAQPGIYNPPGGRGRLFEHFGNLVRGGRLKTLTIDWRGAPERPYHPSGWDHRTVGDLKLLEVPNTMVPTRHPLTKARYLAPWNILFEQPGLERRLASLMNEGSPSVLSGYFHPTNAYDLLAKGAGLRRAVTLSVGSRYLGIGLKHLKRHMQTLLRLKEEHNVKLKFVTASELERILT